MFMQQRHLQPPREAASDQSAKLLVIQNQNHKASLENHDNIYRHMTMMTTDMYMCVCVCGYSYRVLCPLSSVEQRILRFSWWRPPKRMKSYKVHRKIVVHTLLYNNFLFRFSIGENKLPKEMDVRNINFTCSAKNSLSTKSVNCTSLFCSATCVQIKQLTDFLKRDWIMSQVEWICLEN